MFSDSSNFALQAQQALENFKPRKAKVVKKQKPVGGLIAKSVKPAKSSKKEHIPLVFGTKSEPGRIEILLPLRTVSEANCFEAWRNKHKRHKAQKRAVMFAMIPVKHLIKLPCKIKYTRYAPKTLDKFENLPMSFKYLNDQVCAEIMNDFRPGRADGSDQLTIEIDQVKSKEYAVKIEMLF